MTLSQMKKMEEGGKDLITRLTLLAADVRHPTKLVGTSEGAALIEEAALTIDTITTQRKELLEALEAALPLHEWNAARAPGYCPEDSAIRDKIKYAIANCLLSTWHKSKLGF